MTDANTNAEAVERLRRVMVGSSCFEQLLFSKSDVEQVLADLNAAQARAERAESALGELHVVAKRAVRLSLDYSDFKLYAMEPMERAIDHANATLAQVDAESAGDVCDRCKRQYSVAYRVPNDIWAKIAPDKGSLGDHQEHQFGGLLCPDCANNAAAKAGFKLIFCAEVFEAKGFATTGAEPHTDDLAVDRFAAAMKAKLAKKRAEGRGGWDDQEDCTVVELSSMLRKHVTKGDPVDVANFAMMLHERGSEIVPGVDIAVSAQWEAFNKVLHWINTQEEKHIMKGDVYDAVMEMRPALEPVQTHREGWAQAKEAAATEMDLAAHIMSHHGSSAEEQAYQNAAKAIRDMPYPGYTK